MKNKCKSTRIFGPQLAGWALLLLLLFCGNGEAQAASLDFDEPAQAIFKTEDGRTLLIPAGEVYGLRLSADGIIVSGFSDVYSGGSPLCPGQDAGLQTGDILLEAGGEALESCGQFAYLLAQNGEAPMEILFRRGEETLMTILHPVRCESDGLYKAGVWIRDGISGIGTLTYIDPETGAFGALGHGICGDDSQLFSCDGGEVLELIPGETIKGTAGTPGELTGSLSGQAVGRVENNTLWGVFGRYNGETSLSQAVETAKSSEVFPGPAEILADPDGDGAEYYTAEIERLNPQSGADSRNFIIHVTDERLLELTGGIVQGMSGSPIIQDGKLVGAVTHVLVNDPTTGYGIFIENMLDAAA